VRYWHHAGSDVLDNTGQKSNPLAVDSKPASTRRLRVKEGRRHAHLPGIVKVP